MVQAGYSPRSFIEKLGIKPGFTFVLLHLPQEIRPLFSSLPHDITLLHAVRQNVNAIHFFTKEREELETTFPKLAHAIRRDGMVWISWPKGSSKLETDLNENNIRDIGLENGMVDVKVIAVDEDWSGLKFIYKLKDR